MIDPEGVGLCCDAHVVLGHVRGECALGEIEWHVGPQLMILGWKSVWSRPGRINLTRARTVAGSVSGAFLAPALWFVSCDSNEPDNQAVPGSGLPHYYGHRSSVKRKKVEYREKHEIHRTHKLPSLGAHERRLGTPGPHGLLSWSDLRVVQTTYRGAGWAGRRDRCRNLQAHPP